MGLTAGSPNSLRISFLAYYQITHINMTTAAESDENSPT